MLEICIDDPAGLAAAIAGGADRLELCAGLAVGGLTPAAGMVSTALETGHAMDIAVHAIVRPRAGDFAYDRDELDWAIADARALLLQGVDGLVFGAARDGRLDEAALVRWVGAVRSTGRRASLTLHRAIDVTEDPVAAVAVAIRAGFDRILTSGGAAGAPEGAATIARMVRAAGDACRIMPGAGIRPDNVAALIAATGADEVHASASLPVAETDTRVVRAGFAVPRRRADAATVRALRDAIDGEDAPCR